MLDNSFSPERLKEAMAGMSNIDLAEKLGCARSNISMYLSGERTPSKMTIQLISIYLGVNPAWLMGFDMPKYLERPIGMALSLTPSEQRIGLAYGKAPQREQSIVEQVLEPYIDDAEDVIYIKWRISEQAAAAGNGIYLGPETFTEYEVDESKLPHGAAFGVPISGDSMEPKYHDGDIAIISKDFPDVGQVGLFTFDGNGYIKKRGDGVLESFNPKYDDILITDDVIINGRVIGVITWDDVRK